MPIAPTEPGRHGRFSAVDAIRLRTVVELEQVGLNFTDACLFVRQAGVSAFISHVGPGDFLAARWTDPVGTVRHVSGTVRDLALAMPARPVAGIFANISGINDRIARAAAERLSLTVRHGHFWKELPQ